MKQYLAPLAIAFVCGSAFAADPFVGPSVNLRLGYADNKVEYSGFLTADTSKSDALAKIGAGYGFAMGRDWVGTIGIAYQLNKVKFGDTSYVDSGTTYRVSAKLKNDIEVSFAPGYRVAPDALLYGKLAYHRAKGEYYDEQIGNGTSTHDGAGIGFGYVKGIGSNLTVGAEAEYIDYSRESAALSSGKPKQTTLSLTLGYRF